MSQRNAEQEIPLGHQIKSPSAETRVLPGDTERLLWQAACQLRQRNLQLGTHLAMTGR